MTQAERLRIGILERTLKVLDRTAVQRGKGEQAAPHLLIGLAGEEAAYFHLRRKGYTVVARQWKSGSAPGDLDLIAWQGPVLCLVEVKTRAAHDMTPAEAAVDAHKRKILRRLAGQYIRQLPGNTAPQARFDVISAYLVPGQEPELTHFENAFGWKERRELFAL